MPKVTGTVVAPDTPAPTDTPAASESPKPKKVNGSKKEKPKPIERPVLYPKLSSFIAVGDKALTVERAKELMGYEEETDTVKFGADFLFTDEKGTKIRCFNNTINRPFEEPTARKYRQDILKGNWRVNGEAIIIGVTGQVLSGQHRLIGLILAEQVRTGPEKHFWVKFWQRPCIIESFISFGISEDPETLRTMDNVRPRTLADIVCSSGVFRTETRADQKILGTMLDYGISMVWYRTGMKDKKTSFAPERTHSESLDFIERHPRFLEAVRHIKTENKDGKALGKYPSPGYSAALLYLMAASDTKDEDGYRDFTTGNPPLEKNANLGQWKKACAFWSLMAKGGDETAPVRKAIANAADPDSGDPASREEKIGIVIKAWKFFKTGQPFTADDLALEYKEVEGKWRQTEFPDVGGIDRGPTKPAPPAPRPTPEQAAAAAARPNGTPPKKDKPKGDPKPVVPGGAIGETVDAVRKKNPGRVLLFKLKTGNCTAYGTDAVTIGNITDLKPGNVAGLPSILVIKERVNDIVDLLVTTKRQVAFVNPDNTVTDVGTSAAPPVAPPPPKPKPEPKPGGSNPKPPNKPGPGLGGKPAGPTAAESLAKQKAEDEAKKLRGGTNS